MERSARNSWMNPRSADTDNNTTPAIAFGPHPSADVATDQDTQDDGRVDDRAADLHRRVQDHLRRGPAVDGHQAGGDQLRGHEEGQFVALNGFLTPLLVGDLIHWQHDTFLARWHDRELRADAFVTFVLAPDGSIDEVRMVAASPSVDFSYDYHHLELKPVE